MDHLGQNRITAREVFVLELPSLDRLPDTLNLPTTRYFGFFLACDARPVPDDTVKNLAYSLVRGGMAYLCTWGPDCERVHDLFDAVIVELNPHETDQSVRMTTWLDKKSLDEGLWHFLNVAFPADDYWDECKAELVVVIDNEQWSSQIRSRLNDQASLSNDVVGEEEDGEAAV